MNKIFSNSFKLVLLPSSRKVKFFPYRNFTTTIEDRSYLGALKTLDSLQSNTEAVTKWTEERKQNIDADIIGEMKGYLKLLNIEPKDLAKLNAVHVAGTKGKGSTCAFTESILRNGPYNLKTGLYISPHLISVRERISLNGQPLSKDKFTKYFWETYDLLRKEKSEKEMPGFFKFLTLMSFKVFLDEKVDVAVIETGIGGRTDATNVIESPVVCGITSIGWDHVNVLGDTLGKIAYEKSGIFKKEAVGLFSVPQLPEPLDVLKKRSRELASKDLVVLEPHLALNGVTMGIEGEHNKKNATLAIEICRTWLKNKKNIQLKEEIPPPFNDGIVKASILGRAYQADVPKTRLHMYFDGAHTPESLQACKSWFDKCIYNVRQKSTKKLIRVLVFNCSTSRDFNKLLPSLVTVPPFDYIIFTTNENGIEHIMKDRRIEIPQGPNKLAKQQEMIKLWENLVETSLNRGTLFSSEKLVQDSIPSTLQYLHKIEKQENSDIHVLVTGSFHFVGNFMEHLKEKNNMNFNNLDIDKL